MECGRGGVKPKLTNLIPYDKFNRIFFYVVLTLAALAGLALIPVKWSGFLAVRTMPLPTLSDVLQNIALALQGRPNGYARAVHGYAVFAFMAGAFLSAGRALLKPIVSAPEGRSGVLDRLTGRERLAFYFVAGSLVYSLLWLGLGVSGLLNQPIAFAAGIIGWAPAVLELAAGGRSSRNGFRSPLSAFYLRLKRLTPAEAAFLAFAGGTVFFLSSNAAQYPIGPDTLGSHGGLPNYYIQQGRVAFNPHHVYSYLTQNAEMLILWSLLLGSDFASQLLVWGFLVTWLVLIWGFLERHAGSRVSMATVAMVLAVPAVSRSAGEWKNDASVGLFIFAHYVGLIEALRRTPEESDESRKWFLLSGLVLGGAVGHKLLALPVAFFSFLLLAASDGIQRWKKLPLRSFYVPCLIGTLVTASPWLLRCYGATGNPVYPFFENPFPYQISESLKLTRAQYFYDLLFGHVLTFPGISESIAQSIRFEPFWGNIYRPTWGPSLFFALLAVPCAFLPSARGFTLCWLAAALSYIFLLRGSQEYRLHMGPLVFLISTAFALSWRSVLDCAVRKFHGRLVLAAVGFIVLASNVWIATQPSFSLLLSGYAPGNSFSAGSRVGELYWMAHVFNRRSNPGDAVLLAGVLDAYPFKRKHFFTGRMNPEMLGALARRASSSEELEAELRALGVSHVIVADAFYKRAHFPPERSLEILARLDGLLTRRMRVRFALPNRSLVWYSFDGSGPESQIRLDAEDAEAFPGEYISQIKFQRSSGNQAEALRLLEAAMPAAMLNVHKLEIYRMLGDAYRSQGRREELETVLSLSAAENPRSVQALLELAQHYAEADPPDLVRGMELYQAAIQLQPDASPGRRTFESD